MKHRFLLHIFYLVVVALFILANMAFLNELEVFTLVSVQEVYHLLLMRVADFIAKHDSFFTYFALGQNVMLSIGLFDLLDESLVVVNLRKDAYRHLELLDALHNLEYVEVSSDLFLSEAEESVFETQELIFVAAAFQS